MPSASESSRLGRAFQDAHALGRDGARDDPAHGEEDIRVQRDRL